MSANDAWAHTPRQYRPYTYVSSNLPKSTSMTSIDQRSSYVTSTPSRNISTLPKPALAPYNRRRTDTSFPRPPPLHGAPTVAKSGLTASVSSNDISQSSPRHYRFAKVHDSISSIPASRIPTPVRFVSTPVLPSQRAQKEVCYCLQASVAVKLTIAVEFAAQDPSTTGTDLTNSQKCTQDPEVSDDGHAV
jgi:hypothetical protein